MEPWLKKILRLIEQTGDRCIVTDPEGKDIFVMMSLPHYEQLNGLSGEKSKPVQPSGDAGPAQSAQFDLKSLTEEQLLNRINREIATWKDSQTGQNLQSQLNLEENVGKLQDIGVPRSPDETEKDEKFYFEPVDESR